MGHEPRVGKEIGVGFLGALDFKCSDRSVKSFKQKMLSDLYFYLFYFKSHSGFYQNGFGEGRSGIQDFPGGSNGKEFACKAGDLGSIPGLGRSPG